MNNERQEDIALKNESYHLKLNAIIQIGVNLNDGMHTLSKPCLLSTFL